MTVYGGEGNDTITSGSAGGGINSLNGNAGADVFYQVPGVYAHDVISGGVDLPTTVTLTNSNTSTGTSTDTTTTTSTGTATDTTTTTSTSTATGTITTHLTATGTNTSTVTGTATKTRTVTNTNTNTNTNTVTNTVTNTDTNTVTDTVTNTATSTSTATQGDISVDVVDYSNYTVPVKVTLGDEDLAVAASTTIICVDSNMINDYDGFTINDGSISKVVEYHKTGNHAMGTLTCPADAASTGLASNDTFTVDDGVNSPVTFEIIEATDTKTATSTDTNLVITLTGSLDADGVATAIAAGIANYQTTTYTGTAVGTATMTDTSIVPNVTVTTPGAGVVSMQDRNSATPGTFVAAASANLVVANPAAASLQDANANAIVVNVGNADGDDVTVATQTAAAIPGSSGLAVTASRSGIVLTITATATGSKPSFLVAKTSGGAAITTISTGSAKPLGNDGYAAGNEKDTIMADVEVVIGTPYDDIIDATQAYANVHTFFGMAGNDTLIIGAQSVLSNTLYGGPGNDHLQGGSGVDTLFGGNGNDWLAGGLGDDIINGDGPNCVVTSPGVYASSLCDATFAAPSGTAGANVLDYSDRTAAVTVDLGRLTDAANLQIGEVGERDTVTACTNVRGGSGADTLIGDSGNNMIWGGPGDDTISGGPGNDTLYGDMGNDIISGDAGDDFIFGGEGINTIYGDTHGDASIVGNNMVDNSLGTLGTVDCGSGSMDILFSDGHETGVNTCELK